MPFGKLVSSVLKTKIPWTVIDSKCARVNPISGTSVCAKMLSNSAMTIVKYVEDASERMYKNRIKDGYAPKHKTHLCSVQVRLSQIRTNAVKMARVRWNAEDKRVSERTRCIRKNKMNAFLHYFTKGLRLSSDKIKIVKLSRQKRVERAHVVTVDADKYVRNARQLLKYVVINRGDMFEAVVAIALLTGRRSSEILKTAVIAPISNPPKYRKTNNVYWGRVSGFLKHKPGSNISRDVPMLCSRELINQGLVYIRSFVKPSLTVDQLNKTYASRIQARVHKLCPELRTLHTLRKFFSLVAHHYFKSDIRPGSVLSLPQFASHVLGHIRLSDTVITYLNINIRDIGNLSFT